ncbi:4Fe-4S dicluster domain-containing protein [Fundidesulfovibrio butyratiphilus]
MPKRLGLVIDLDRCTGCGACQAACRLENNIPPERPALPGVVGAPFERPVRASDWLVLRSVRNAKPFPDADRAFVPVMCQHCDKPPCVAVCPVGATGKSSETGVVYQVYARCIGCRACLAACPYGAKVFNWSEPVWPGRTGLALTPFASARGKGVAEKCDLCVRLEHREHLFEPACARACPSRAMVFGDLDDPESRAGKLAAGPLAFRLEPAVRGDGSRSAANLGPRVVYVSRRAWLKDWAENGGM